MLRASKSSKRVKKQTLRTPSGFAEAVPYVPSAWKPGLPDEHWGGRMWLRSDKVECIVNPCMALGNIYYVTLVLPTGYTIISRDRLEEWAGPGLRWAKCIAPDE
jgi:hypothetical protein